MEEKEVADSWSFIHSLNHCFLRASVFNVCYKKFFNTLPKIGPSNSKRNMFLYEMNGPLKHFFSLKPQGGLLGGTVCT